MARYTEGGEKVPTEIWEAAMMARPIKVQCTVGGCENSSVFHPAGLWYLFDRRGWQQSFEKAQQRFWCRKCTGAVGWRVKKAVILMTRDQINVTSLPLPSDRQWKNFISRHRG